MALFEALKRNDYKWVWFIFTVVFSFIPVIIRVVFAHDLKVNLFDIKDFLFAGLAINIANLNLIGSKDFDIKLLIAGISSLFIVLFGVALGIVMKGETDKIKDDFTVTTILSVLGSLASVYISFEANNYVFKTV